MINRTEGLKTEDPVLYTGIWVPSVTAKSINDRDVYETRGAFVRYLSSNQILYISMSETPFFIKNIQEPIVRSGEMIFNNILFSTMCLELFALSFLMFKLAILPIVKQILFRIKKYRSSRFIRKTAF